MLQRRSQSASLLLLGDHPTTVLLYSPHVRTVLSEQEGAPAHVINEFEQVDQYGAPWFHLTEFI